MEEKIRTQDRKPEQGKKSAPDKEKTAKKLRTLKHAVVAVVFILLLCILYGRLSTLLRDKAAMEYLITFYDEPENSIDVIFAGTSHSLNAYYPMEFWNRRGFTSYNMSQNGQMMALTYYCVEEALRMQQPKVVVVDLYYAVKNPKFGSDAFTHETIDNLRWSPVKVKAILDGTKRELWAEMFFPTIVYHTRWDSLKTKDFEMTVNRRRGSGLNYTVKEAITPEITQTDQVGGMSAPSREYLLKIIELCEKKQIPLVFTVVPYSVGNDNSARSAEDQLAVFNEARDMAAEHGVAYLNLLEHLEELNLDFETDCYDQTHLNALGAEKVSAYMADWLAENYDLPDHRDDPAYKRWKDDYKQCFYQKRSVKTKALPTIDSIVAYFRCLKDEADYLVLLNMGGNNTDGLTDKAVEAMKACGIETDLRELNKESWVAVLDKGKLAYEERSPEKIQYAGEYEDLRIKLFSQLSGTYFNSMINGEKVGPNQPTLNVVVYSLSQKKVVDSVAFNIGTEECKAIRVK